MPRHHCMMNSSEAHRFQSQETWVLKSMVPSEAVWPWRRRLFSASFWFLRGKWGPGNLQGRLPWGKGWGRRAVTFRTLRPCTSECGRQSSRPGRHSDVSWTRSHYASARTRPSHSLAARPWEASEYLSVSTSLSVKYGWYEVPASQSCYED